MRPIAARPGVFGAATIALVCTVVGTTVVGRATAAAYTDTIASGPTTMGAATVKLGDGGAGPDLSFRDLVPGSPQTVQLTVDYVGTVPADLSVTVTPGAGSALCARSDAGWSARPGASATIAVGGRAPTSFCSLYSGEALPLATGAQPGSTTTVPVVLTMSSDSSLPASSQTDVLTIHADGGFTDRADGTLALSTVAPPADSAPALAVAEAADPAAAQAVATSADPAAAARAAGTTVAIPAECAAAGMTASSFAEVVTVDTRTRRWDAGVERGRGTGPFLVLGTSGEDTIVGSDRADCIVGGAGNDIVSGGTGADVLVGGPGDDRLRGDAGADRLYGGPGRDDLVGADGVDLFDGGASGATCDAAVGERAAACTTPPVTTTPPVPTTTATVVVPPPPATTSAPPTTTSAEPTTTVSSSTEPAPTTG
ncbi:calcium-binding protein [Pseudonocardia sp.]|uniref:calcium-binding protein n=1 Tax=Pseudonocardia sp. TaxID=60912 RepID=UPI003D11291E